MSKTRRRAGRYDKTTSKTRDKRDANEKRDGTGTQGNHAPANATRTSEQQNETAPNRDDERNEPTGGTTSETNRQDDKTDNTTQRIARDETHGKTT